MFNPENGRTVEKIKRMASEKVKSKKFNCSHPPIFDFIPITRVIPDSLHLFSRIADQIIHQLIKELKTEDNVQKLTTYDKTKLRKISAFEEFVKSLGMHDFNFYVDKDTKMLKYRDFTGPDKYKLLRHIKISDFLPGERANKLQEVWDSFLLLIDNMQNLEKNSNQITKFQDNAKKWVRSYTKLYQSKDVTPYMHILMNHVHETVNMNGNMTKFTMQGFGKIE